MYGLELLARREGLGVSKPAMAEALGVREKSLDRWEFGKNPPQSWDWIEDALNAMEEYQDQLADQMVQAVLEQVQAGGEPIIMSYSTRVSFYGWNPQAREVCWGEEQMKGVPVELHRGAAALARRILRRDHQITATIDPVPAPRREEDSHEQ